MVSPPAGGRDIIARRSGSPKEGRAIVLSPRFVFLHLPKTGGSFASKMLAGVLRPRNFPERLLRRWFGKHYIFTNQHGTRREIPEGWRHLPVLSIVRNPYDRYVSEYFFGRWKLMRNEWVDWEGIRRDYPRFPDLSFPEFVEIATGRLALLRQPDHRPEDRFGRYSEQFVDFFWRDPEKAYPAMDDAWMAARGWEAELEGVRFLHQDSLNRELHDYLREAGYPERRVAFILDHGKIQPKAGAPSTRPQDRHWSTWYTGEARAMVRHRDRLLFSIFPEYDAWPAPDGPLPSPDPQAALPGPPPR